MIKDFNWAMLKQPRVAMRALVAALLAANLVAAVVAFKPFGGSADDLRKEESQLQDQLAAAQARLAISKKLVNKVQTAGHDGDEFLRKYVVDRRVASSTVSEELNRLAGEAGVSVGQTAYSYQEIEGSDTLQMLTINAGVTGNYINLMRFVNLVDRSSRFLIIESLQTAAPPQNGQPLPVQFKLDTFVQGAEL
jgi:type IV pilus assembly protein PilO